jgi:hypothetical protein
MFDLENFTSANAFCNANVNARSDKTIRHARKFLVFVTPGLLVSRLYPTVGRNTMKLKNLGYAALVTVATAAFVLGTAGTSEAAKKKAAAKPATQPMCQLASGPVCATRGGNKFTYANACFAGNDGAMVVSKKACPPAKAMKKGGKKKSKKAKAKKMKK